MKGLSNLHHCVVCFGGEHYAGGHQNFRKCIAISHQPIVVVAVNASEVKAVDPFELYISTCHGMEMAEVDGVPCGSRQHIIICRQEVPVVACYLVEALVIERGHQLCVGRLAIGSEYGECPFLFLSWYKIIAECLPCQAESVVFLRTANLCTVSECQAVANPCHVEHQTVAVFLFVLELTCGYGIALVKGALFEYLVITIEKSVDKMLVAVG